MAHISKAKRQRPARIDRASTDGPEAFVNHQLASSGSTLVTTKSLKESLANTLVGVPRQKKEEMVSMFYG